MSTPILTASDLLDLAENLQRMGFTVDLHQILQAQHLDSLFLALAASDDPVTPHRVRNLLAPVFCTTPEEQDTFYTYFDEWLGRRPELQDRFDDGQSPPRPPVNGRSGTGNGSAIGNAEETSSRDVSSGRCCRIGWRHYFGVVVGATSITTIVSGYHTGPGIGQHVVGGGGGTGLGGYTRYGQYRRGRGDGPR